MTDLTTLLTVVEATFPDYNWTLTKHEVEYRATIAVAGIPASGFVEGQNKFVGYAVTVEGAVTQAYERANRKLHGVR